MYYVGIKLNQELLRDGHRAQLVQLISTINGTLSVPCK